MASVGFRWLDILEKEFDKAFVDLDLSIGELDSDEPDVVFNVRQKLCSLSSCFAQLTHKAQTIFQNSAKIEAELIHMRAELVESKAKKEVLEHELHNLLLQLHSSQLAQIPDGKINRKQDGLFKPDVNNIKKKLDAELQQSPIRNPRLSKQNSGEELKFGAAFMDGALCRAENIQLQMENAALRNTILSLNSEMYGAKLAAKHLDKELAGRIQQLQLLGREMRGDVRDKVWRQLESEILLQRHKTVVRACRRSSNTLTSLKGGDKLAEIDSIHERTEHFGDIRTVVVKRNPNQGLGISITGGREHGVPILISELEPNGPASLSEQLYIGDAILSVNERDLRQACHGEAVDILQQQTGDCTLQVQYIAADDSDASLEEDGYNFRFFDGDGCDLSNFNGGGFKNTINSMDMLNTPTAPRTPESSSAASRINSTHSLPSTPEKPLKLKETKNVFNYNLNKPNELFKPVKSIKEVKKIVSDLNYNLNETNDVINQNSISTTILYDNATNNIIKLNDFKKVDIIDDIITDNNFNYSTNSLNSENFSSPMQTSADAYLDSEAASTDSQSPKNIQQVDKQPINAKNQVYTSNESLSNPKSDQSLLNSESSGDSPLHKASRDYKKPQRKPKKKYFGVKTLQSIFNKQQHDGYSDISSTASEIGDEVHRLKKSEMKRETTLLPKSSSPTDTNAQFEENIHTFLSDIFVKNFMPPPHGEATGGGGMQPVKGGGIGGTKKYFSLHGQNLRVGKALRLCPNEDYSEQVENEQRKEKLLARYVYNASSIGADGVGDPDFGTPV